MEQLLITKGESYSKLYFYKKNDKVEYICDVCNKKVIKNVESFLRFPETLCRNHIMLKKYGVENNSQRPEVKAKVK
jgi:hypothetical protein